MWNVEPYDISPRPRINQFDHVTSWYVVFCWITISVVWGSTSFKRGMETNWFENLRSMQWSCSNLWICWIYFLNQWLPNPCLGLVMDFVNQQKLLLVHVHMLWVWNIQELLNTIVVVWKQLHQIVEHVHDYHHCEYSLPVVGWYVCGVTWWVVEVFMVSLYTTSSTTIWCCSLVCTICAASMFGAFTHSCFIGCTCCLSCICASS